MMTKIVIWAGLLLVTAITDMMSAKQVALDTAAGRGFSFGGTAALWSMLFLLIWGIYSAHLLLPEFKSRSIRDITVGVLGFIIAIIGAKILSFIF